MLLIKLFFDGVHLSLVDELDIFRDVTLFSEIIEVTVTVAVAVREMGMTVAIVVAMAIAVVAFRSRRDL